MYLLKIQNVILAPAPIILGEFRHDEKVVLLDDLGSEFLNA